MYQKLFIAIKSLYDQDTRHWNIFHATKLISRFRRSSAWDFIGDIANRIVTLAQLGSRVAASTMHAYHPFPQLIRGGRSVSAPATLLRLAEQP
jgi:hypothetical protein